MLDVLWQDAAWIIYLMVGLLGLCVGSFLNVVIYRIPQMMETEFKSECEFYLNPESTQQTEAAQTSSMTLSTPGSHCPKCNTKIKWYDNLPVISWLLLKAKCRSCDSKISARYPAVELITALLSLACVYMFGPTLAGFGALVLCWSLVALTGIDFDHQLLPDRITLPLAAAGLVFSTQSTSFVGPSESIWGFALGFLSLWVVYKAFLLLTGKHGMGYGDFKLLAALGAWLGTGMLPLIIIAAAGLGSVVGLLLIRLTGENKAFAFGPALAIGGLVALFFGQPIMDWYLGMY